MTSGWTLAKSSAQFLDSVAHYNNKDIQPLARSDMSLFADCSPSAGSSRVKWYKADM